LRMFLSHEAVKQRRGEMKRASAVGMVLVLGLLFGGSFMAASQAEGEGDRGELTREEIIQRATEYLEGAATYSVDVSVLIKMDFGIFKHEMEAEYRIAVERPNKFAIVPSGAMEMVFGARVCDGERLYNHQPMMKRYTVEEAPEKTGADLVSTSLAAGPMGLFISGFFTEMDELEMVQPAEEGGCEFEYVGIEEIDGVKCHRVRRRYAEAPLEGVECEMWIDAGEKPLPRRMSQDLSGMYSRVMQDVDDKDIPDVFGKGQFKEMFKDAEYVIAARFENWKVNARLPEDTFKFTRMLRVAGGSRYNGDQGVRHIRREAALGDGHGEGGLRRDEVNPGSLGGIQGEGFHVGTGRIGRQRLGNHELVGAGEGGEGAGQ